MLWGSVLVVTVFVYAFFSALGQPPAPKTHRVCVQRVTYPAKRDCTDRHGYVWQDGAWYDMGELRPGALAKGTPAR